MCTTPELLSEELEYLRDALVRCKYHRWAINKIQNKYTNNNWEKNGNNDNSQQEDSTQGPNRGICTEDSNNNDKPNAGHIVVPHVQGLWENLKKICSRYGVETHFRESTTIKQMLIRPKNKDSKECQSNVMYSYQCTEVDCSEKYIGETSRTLGEGTKSILNNHPLFMHTASRQDTVPVQTISAY